MVRSGKEEKERTMAEVVVRTVIVRQEAHCVVPYDMFGVFRDESYTRDHVSRGAQVSVLRVRGKGPRTADSGP